MKISTAFRRASRLYFGHFGAAMGFLVVELCLLLMALAPLLFLTNDSLKILALLAVPFYLLLILWARVNAAGAMQNALEGGSLLSYRLADLTAYGRKLLCGLIRGLFLLVWAIPLIAELVVGRDYYSGGTDGFTLMRMIKDFGGGDLMTGIGYLLLIVLASLLLIVVGCAFHSGARHAFVLEDRKCLKGHHGKLMLCWLCAEWTILPLLISLAVLVVRYLPVLKNLTTLLMSGLNNNLPDTKVSLIILGAGALVTFLLLPLRALIIAAFVNGLSHGKEKDA